ncbi:dihydrofolate reductase family protein [Streptomyces sp. NPDC021020]|uniref:dihydrofolate reductase family protein n=1 Tax=Streptomyces sp. NPDC021020 TaxID=3365109 RepID=UPI00379C555D
MRIVAIEHMTLDGVVQAPGRPDEDTRGGFTAGGWAAERAGDGTVARIWGERLSAGSGFLLGRRTYDDVLGHWNAEGGPFRDALNAAPKYVASRSLAEPLPWPNSALLGGDVPAAVAGLRQAPGGDLHIMGSAELVASLAAHGLVDTYVLCVHPIVLGAGRRLFAEGFAPAAFEAVEVTPTPSGVVVAVYASAAASS